MIDLDDELYNFTKEHKLMVMDLQEVEKAIKNGILLPKGHGRLIDADETKKKIEQFWIDKKGFSLIDALDVIDLETNTYARPDRRNKYA